MPVSRIKVLSTPCTTQASAGATGTSPGGGDEGLYQQLYRQPKEEGVPLNLGEPEMPYCVELYPAVFESVGVIPH